ncbi:MAG: serine/threonine protein phosphatase [Proteobacteria bacterium]|nr:serine/threonine protein phosphatase [Pseudomonadota bacterium]MBU1739509.1 serine/threonine protein phosphatase [Pseudomonadota bacterium]
MTSHSGKIFAIGDLHGCFAKLQKLLSRIPYEPGRDRLVFLGDYIDRGPDTAKVLDLLCELKEQSPDLIALLGNHEYLLLEYHRSGDPALLPYLRKMGIDSTLKSYGVHTGFSLRSLSFMPAAHLDFLENLRLYWESEEYIFAHAGLEPGVPLTEQDATSFCEARDSFLSSTVDFGKKVIFGHTEFELPLVTPNKIGIDTGAVYGNILTAVELPGEHFYHA